MNLAPRPTSPRTTSPPTASPSDDFAPFFRAHCSYVWCSLRRLGVRDADLEDQAHETFLAIYRHRESFDSSRPLRPWIFGFALRVASDYRKNVWQKRRSPDAPKDEPDTRRLPDELVSKRQEQALVIEVLEQIELDRRAVLVMHEIDGEPIPVVAEALAIPLNTAYSRLRLARADFDTALRRLRNHDQHPPLPPWDSTILAAEREREGPSDAQSDALLARLDQSITTIAAASGPAAEIAASATASASSVPLTAGMALRQKLLGTALTYLVGVATGALVHDRVTRRSRDVPAAARIAGLDSTPSAQPAGSPVVTSPRDSGALSATVRAADDAGLPQPGSGSSADAGRVATLTDASAPRVVSRQPQRGSNDLFAETNVIEMARSALARGRASAALDALEQHRRQFASGQLAEDRESLAVEALVTLGRADDARRRAEAFRRRWPDGVYRARVDAALALIQ